MFHNSIATKPSKGAVVVSEGVILDTLKYNTNVTNLAEVILSNELFPSDKYFYEFFDWIKPSFCRYDHFLRVFRHFAPNEMPFHLLHTEMPKYLLNERKSRIEWQFYIVYNGYRITSLNSTHNYCNKTQKHFNCTTIRYKCLRHMFSHIYFT